MSDFANRLEKNARHRQKWAKRHDLTGFRVYDLDIPAWPYAIDVYGDFIHIMEFPRSRQSRETVDTLRTHVIDAVMREKPAGAKGHYIRSLTLTTTMGPGVRMDIAAATAPHAVAA